MRSVYVNGLVRLVLRVEFLDFAVTSTDLSHSATA